MNLPPTRNPGRQNSVPMTERKQPDGPDRSVDIAPGERIGRVIIGLAAIVAAAILLTSAASAIAVVLGVLLIAAGLDLAVTGALGHCPLYAKLGHIPPTFRRAQ